MAEYKMTDEELAAYRKRKSEVSDIAMAQRTIEMYRESDPEQAKAVERELARMEKRPVEDWAKE